MHGPCKIRGNESPEREIVTKESWLSNEKMRDRWKEKWKENPVLRRSCIVAAESKEENI